MLYNRIYNRIWILFISCSLFCLLTIVNSLYAADFNLSVKARKGLEDFLAGNSTISRLTCDKLLVNLHLDKNGRLVSAAEQNGGFYSLVLCPLWKDNDRDTVAEIENTIINFSLMTARSRLAFYIGYGNIDRNLYCYDEALGEALLSYYTRPELQKILHEQGIIGIETASSVIDENPKIVIGLAWVSPDLSKFLEKDIPAFGVLDDEYCRFLYMNHAKNLFQAEQYIEALPLFKNIHDLHWMDIRAYLDAAECFLKIGETKECLIIVKGLRTALGDEMSSNELARAGRLCRTAGDREAALEAFTQARVRLHEENNRISTKIRRK